MRSSMTTLTTFLWFITCLSIGANSIKISRQTALSHFAPSSPIKIVKKQGDRDAFPTIPSPPVIIDHNYYNRPIPEKSASVMSYVSDMAGSLWRSKPEDQEPELHGIVAYDSPGWGWHKPEPKYKVKEKDDGHDHHKIVYNIKTTEKEKGGSKFDALDALLSILSLVSFGAFLMNLLALLMSLLGYGFTTVTYPTGGGTSVTVTGNPTPTGGGTATGGTATGGTATGGTATGGTAAALMNRLTLWVQGNPRRRRRNRNRRRKKKRKRKRVRLRADTNFDDKDLGETSPSPQSNQDETDSEAGETEPDFDYTDDQSFKDSQEDYDRSRASLRRKARSVVTWEPSMHPYVSLDIAARSILNSIASANENFACMEKVICDSVKYSKVIGRGMQYFMPIYSFTVSHFGQKTHSHSKMSDHFSAIILGVQESNCNAIFPECPKD